MVIFIKVHCYEVFLIVDDQVVTVVVLVTGV